ncbi:MAG: YbaB/EbfC family nucleoid-associated protein [Oscillospiraceae bacterium]|nr:YbaB/EbfC family nucleoid-associated protein [Oscillospiraceae bacterium]
MKSRLPAGMGGGAQNMNQMMKQVQNMQAQITELQQDIETREFNSSAGGGAVAVTMSGKKEIKSLEIKPEVVDPDDIEMLQDLIISAFNDTVRKIEETTESEMGAITGGVNLPGIF